MVFCIRVQCYLPPIRLAGEASWYYQPQQNSWRIFSKTTQIKSFVVFLDIFDVVLLCFILLRFRSTFPNTPTSRISFGILFVQPDSEFWSYTATKILNLFQCAPLYLVPIFQVSRRSALAATASGAAAAGAGAAGALSATCQSSTCYVIQQLSVAPVAPVAPVGPVGPVHWSCWPGPKMESTELLNTKRPTCEGRSRTLESWRFSTAFRTEKGRKLGSIFRSEICENRALLRTEAWLDLFCKTLATWNLLGKSDKVGNSKNQCKEMLRALLEMQN